MDQRHRELARIGLTATQNYGFALAGGYALVTHGLVDRVTEDVDLFPTTSIQTSSLRLWKRSALPTSKPVMP